MTSMPEMWAAWLAAGERDVLDRWRPAAPARESVDDDVFYLVERGGEAAGVGATAQDAMDDYIQLLCDVLADPEAAARTFAQGPWTSAEEMLLAHCTGVRVRKLGASQTA